MHFYAVARGHRPGVYSTLDEAKKQVERFPNARHKKFGTEKEARAFVTQDDASGKPVRSKAAAWSGCRAAGRGLRERLSSDTAYCSRLPSDPNPRDSSTLVAFTDGSAFNNGRPGCRAGWACVFPHNQGWNRAEPLTGWRQTNNRAEYRAAIEAVLRANEEDSAKAKPLYIYSDSMLLIRSMTEWLPGWISREWRKWDGGVVLNADLLKTLLKEQGKRRIIWKHAPAHTNRKDWKSKWNNIADRLAKQQASQRTR